MTTQNIDLVLEIGASFRGEIPLVTDETGRTHRMQIRSEVGSTFVQMELSTGDGITADETKLSLYRGASVTEVLSLETDTAHWVYDIESINDEDPDDVRRLARGLVLVSRDVTRDTEPTPAANASKLLTYSLTDGQTLTTEEQEHVREKIGASGGGSTITTEDITDMTTIGREIATAEDAAAVRTALNVPSVDDIAGYEFVSYQDQGLITDPAKAQARANMDAMSIYQGLRVDVAQGLDGDQKNQGRVNLDVPSNAALTAETTARTDQFNALDAYAQGIETALNNLDASLAVVAKTGDYNDLINKPGGLAIGATVASATANRIFQAAPAGTTLQQQGTWYFDALGFGAIQPSAQCLRTTDGGGGYVASIGGGVVLGRTDDGPQMFAGFYTGGGVVVKIGSAFRFGNSSTDIRTSDGHLQRRAANIIEGAALALRPYTLANLATMTGAEWLYTQVICTNDSTGARPVWFNGTNWLRVSDNTISA